MRTPYHSQLRPLGTRVSVTENQESGQVFVWKHLALLLWARALWGFSPCRFSRGHTQETTPGPVRSS